MRNLGKISELHLNIGSGKDFISTSDKNNQYLTTISVKVVSHLSEFVKLQLNIPSAVLLLYSTEVLCFVSFSVFQDILSTW